MEGMMESSTKDRILDMALVNFSKYGYEGTNLRDLAKDLGLSKSALYKHFESKEDIWNALLTRMHEYYIGKFGSADSTGKVPESLDGLYDYAMRQIDFTVHDEKVVMVRRLLLTEQFRDDAARSLATGHLLTGLEEMYTVIFGKMMEKGLLKKDDPAMLAFCFTTPVSALVQLCDREPDREKETFEKISDFIRHFIKIYGIVEN